MPTVYDNISNTLFNGLKDVLQDAYGANFCIGYFHLRGWHQIAKYIERFDGNKSCCKILIGMYRPPEKEMQTLQSALKDKPSIMDGPTIARLRKRIIEGFKEQIEFGVPSSIAESTLRTLGKQLRTGKVKVKLFLRYPLHAKLYLIERKDKITPLIGFVGSSNLTLSGLSQQGELNMRYFLDKIFITNCYVRKLLAAFICDARNRTQNLKF